MLDERLAKRFHTTIEVLKEVNTGGQAAGASESDGPIAQATLTPDVERPDGEQPSYFEAVQQIRVPNIGRDRIENGRFENRDSQRTLASLGAGSDQPEADRIVVSKADNTLKAYQADKLVALFTVRSGSSEFPLPRGEWDIVSEA